MPQKIVSLEYSKTGYHKLVTHKNGTDRNTSKYQKKQWS